ncbi:NfeD family protein [Xylocopilactobacillus apicola]|uniref:RCK C-terminal domain-containing protein n=1 Tax=Xylocopilactobacillus apicola TaxID=2932184 RepID=A0AAU9DEB1_9LACO|nr:hypothetical protein [Xylocopilactobacillus apicola]BDR58200.1 hypothetical protein XA3_06410 [Xylocopilactobacillus apicola]
MDYNFDDRLLWESVELTKENFHDNLLRLNGIYYRYECSTPLKIGETVIITGIKGNVLLLEKYLAGGKYANF